MTMGGGAVTQMSIGWEQRGANGQPGSGLVGSGGEPAMPRRTTSAESDSVGALATSACV